MRTQTFMTAMLVALAMGVGTSGDARGYTTHHRGMTNSYRTNNYRNTGNNGGRVMVPAGTAIDVRLNQTIATDNAHRGDTWTGTVNNAVVTSGGVAIEAGAPVEGTIANVVEGTHTTPAQVSLTLRRVTMNGQSRTMFAQASPIVADTQRAHKLGAIIGGGAAGALLGHTVAKDSHGTLIGGLAGAAAGYGLTRHAFRTMQLKEGTVIRFVTTERMLATR